MGNPPPDDHPNPAANLPIAGGDLGARQRLRHSTPNPKTILQLGAKLAGSLPFGFDGVSLLSGASLFAKVAEKTFLDLFGTTVFQSHEELQHWSTAFGSEVNEQKDAGDAADLEPHDVGEHHERVKTETEKLQALFSSIADKVSYVKKGVFLAAPSGKEKWGKFFVTSGPFAYSKWNKGKASEEASELTLFGKEGVGIISPEEVSIMAKDGTKIFGGQEVKLTGGVEVAIDAGAEAKVFAVGEATFEAGIYADIKAGREVEISALHGPVDIKGRTIEIGKHVRSLNQDKTTDITASAATSVELRAEKIEIGAKQKPKPGKAAAEASSSTASKERQAVAPTALQDKAKEVSIEASEEIKLHSDKMIHLEAAKNVIINVGDFHVMVTEKQVRIGHKSNPTALIQLKDNEINLMVGKIGVAVGTSGKQIAMQAGSSHVILKESGKVSVKASNIELG